MLINVDYDVFADYCVFDTDSQENHVYRDTDYIHLGLIDYFVFRPADLVLEELRSSRGTGLHYFVAPACWTGDCSLSLRAVATYRMTGTRSTVGTTTWTIS